MTLHDNEAYVLTVQAPHLDVSTISQVAAHIAATKFPPPAPSRSLFRGSRNSTVTILPTARVKLTMRNGRSVVVKACLDSGAENGFLTTHCCQLLGLKPKPALSVSGLSEAQVE